METFFLEVNLISAQNLKVSSSIPFFSSSEHKSYPTYATAWIISKSSQDQDSNCTRVNHTGGSYTTWNDKFIFRVSSDFLSKETSGVNVDIFAIRTLKHQLIGKSRILLSNCFPSYACRSRKKHGYGSSYSFKALPIQQPSGELNGILNVAVMMIKSSDYFSPVLPSAYALDFRQLMMGDKTPSRAGRRSSSSTDSEESKNKDLGLLISAYMSAALKTINIEVEKTAATTERWTDEGLVVSSCLSAGPKVIDQEVQRTREEESSCPSEGNTQKSSRLLELSSISATPKAINQEVEGTEEIKGVSKDEAKKTLKKRWKRIGSGLVPICC